MMGLKLLDKIPQTVDKNIDYFQYADKTCKVASAAGALALLHFSLSGRMKQISVLAKSATNLRTYTFAGMGILSTTNIGKMAYQYITDTSDKDEGKLTFSKVALQLNLVAFHWAFVGSRVMGMFGPTKRIAAIIGTPINYLVMGLDGQSILATLCKRSDGKKDGAKDALSVADDGLDFVSAGLDALDQTGTLSLAAGAVSGVFNIISRSLPQPTD